MNQAAKMLFVDELFASIRKTILENIEKMPPEWDGIELREYAADKFSESTLLHNRLWKPSSRKEMRRRAKDYENEVIVRNL